MAFSHVGRKLHDIQTPAFLVDKAKVEKNCKKMLNTCKEMGVHLRAATKTHKTIEGGKLQTGETCRRIVVSTLSEAEFYAEGGFDDILYGYPLIPQHLPRATRLTEKLDAFHLMTDSKAAVDVICGTTPPVGKAWSVFLKVDCGNRRAGVWWENKAEGLSLARQLQDCPHVAFQGLYVHCGNSYKAKCGEVGQVRDETIERLLSFAECLTKGGIRCKTVGIGSTPTCSTPGDMMKNLTELHPGNYIFLDIQQYQLGSCSLDDIACCIATRVIGHYPHRNQMLIDCGFTALTKQGWGEMKTGYAVIKDHPNLKLIAMTQEIGYVEPLTGKLDYSLHPLGSMLFLYPWHACATAGMQPVYLVVRNGYITEEWKPVSGW